MQLLGRPVSLTPNNRAPSDIYVEKYQVTNFDIKKKDDTEDYLFSITIL